eukprot:TRINITY_DN2347_c1_g1_i1.p1 TRINITY_DN2347_c1_g1~~TRINITY_DN2347_c1_g1_i1.p1  ORF type:complete len:364 (-),score=80.51 TRINITY_DN2347_c1_g1_i1:443-1534(-)
MLRLKAKRFLWRISYSASLLCLGGLLMVLLLGQRRARPGGDVLLERAGIEENVLPRIFMPNESSDSSSGITSSKRSSDIIQFDMNKRVWTMRNACDKHGLSVRKEFDPLYRPNGWEYFINKEFNLIWCTVFKSGSSSWMHIFNRLIGYKESYLSMSKLPLVHLARKKYARPSGDELLRAMNESTSFIVGRHPFERLISGYRDKIIKAHVNSYHDQMKRRILMEFRGLSPKAYVPGVSNPTFQEFFRYIMKEHQRSSNGEMDMHWTPVHRFCNPCQVRFSDIILFETFDRDTNFLLEKTGILPKFPDIRPQKLNAAKDGKKSSELMMNYLKELSLEEYKSLSELYAVDFDIFGYPLPTYQEIHS